MAIQREMIQSPKIRACWGGFLLKTGGLALSILFGATIVFAQNPLGLPEAAEQFWSEGLEGFRQGDWGRAIRNLREVQSIAPAVPSVIYNLALSYDFSAFRELSAIGWLNTYIAAAPDARNVEQTRVRIADLDKAAVARLTGLFETAKEAVESLRGTGDANNLVAAYGQIAAAQARSRVIPDEALNTANQIPGVCRPCRAGRPEQERTAALQRILGAQLLAGDLDEGFITARTIDSDPVERDSAFADLASAYASRGNVQQAEAAVQEIVDATRKDAARLQIESILLGVDTAGPSDGGAPELDAWLDFMRERGPSLEVASEIFIADMGEREPLEIVDTLVEAAVAYGQELARLRQMQESS